MKIPFRGEINQLLHQARFKLSANNFLLYIAFYRFFYRPKKNSLAKIIQHYSRSLRNELQVIQIGANDGMRHDPIHKFIKSDNWKGVLLEPQPYVYNKYLKRLYKRSNDIHTMCAAIGENDGVQPLYRIGFSNMRWATGLASFVREQVVKAFENGLVADRCAKYGIAIPENKSEHIIAEEVAVISPTTLIKKYAIDNIDLLMIDTEGFDYEVIKIFNVEKTKPHMIIYENEHLSSGDNQSCESLLRRNSYRLKHFHSNTVAVQEPLGVMEEFFK